LPNFKHLWYTYINDYKEENKIANHVYNIVDVTLQDGTEVGLRPVNIKRLKRFVLVIDKFSKAVTEEETLDLLIDAAQICLEGVAPEVAADRDKLEDLLDKPTLFKILDVCGGLNLSDPNLEALAREMQDQVVPGTN